MPRIIVVGGGVTGLTAAYRLSRLRPDWHVKLLEASPDPGGKVQTVQIGEMLVERGADSFLSRKVAAIELLQELGLLDQIQGRNPDYHRTFVQYEDVLYPLPEGLTGLIPTNLQALQNSRLLSPGAVERIAAEADVPPHHGEEETVAEFMTRRFGRELFERLIEPLTAGIYGGRADLLSVDAVFPQLRRLEREHGSLLRAFEVNSKRRADARPAPYPPFVSLKRGMGQLTQTLAARLASRIITDATVTAVHASGSGYIVHWQGADGPVQEVAEGIITALPAHAAARVLSPLDGTLAQLLRQIEYSSAALVTLALDLPQQECPFDGYGYLIPKVTDKEVLALTWSSNKWVGRVAPGRQLVRLFLGRYGHDVTGYSDARLIELARCELAQTFDLHIDANWSRVDRWPAAIPQYFVGHERRVHQIERVAKSHDRLQLAGAYFDGVGIPDCIRHGDAAAHRLVAQLN